jgi:hypothetical protein
MPPEVRITGSTKFVTVTPTIVAAAYADGDVIGTNNPIALSEVVRGDALTALLMSVQARDKSNSRPALDIIFFHTTPSGTTFTDNAAVSVVDGDLAKIAAVVSIATTDWINLGAGAVAFITGIAAPVQAIAGARKLFAAIVARGAVTFGSASDLSLEVGFFQD